MWGTFLESSKKVKEDCLLSLVGFIDKEEDNEEKEGVLTPSDWFLMASLDKNKLWS